MLIPGMNKYHKVSGGPPCGRDNDNDNDNDNEKVFIVMKIHN